MLQIFVNYFCLVTSEIWGVRNSKIFGKKIFSTFFIPKLPISRPKIVRRKEHGISTTLAWPLLRSAKFFGKQMIRHSGCGSVGRTVASDTIGPRLESKHRSKLYLPTINSIENTKIIKKMLGMAEFKKTNETLSFSLPTYLFGWRCGLFFFIFVFH